jgi:protein-S-isoprenylcysteine O-methyltransferase Ste14
LGAGHDEVVNMELIGRTTIHPVVFYSGKCAGYLTWALLGLDHAGLRLMRGLDAVVLDRVAYAFLGVASVFIVSSLVSLGGSTRLGLPTGPTELKTGGIYRVSRNPMYVGFDALSLAAMLGLGHPIVLGLGAYSIVVYHLIIVGEERFLAATFGAPYAEYRGRVRRYL